ncbi:MAG: hypothetical protein V4649_12390 [Bacteroidota bacterium]
MTLLGLFFVLLMQFICGRGIISLFRVALPAIDKLCLSLILGVPMVSFVPCILQLAGVPITASATALGITILACLLLIPQLLPFRRPALGRVKLPKIYEVPFLLIFLLHIVVSVWRCYYYPPTARDMLAGPEVISEFTVREGTMVNSVFSIDLQTTNNYFKSPFITSLQVIYKLLVCAFGQVWLSVIAIPFLVWLYVLLRRLIHPLVAGFLFLLFLIMPELFAYTYLMLYDYCNMVFFVSGFYFLVSYLRERKSNRFAFAIFLFGLATYIRTETLVLVGMGALPLFIYNFSQKKLPLLRNLVQCLVLILPSVCFYIICVHLFVRNFVPIPFDLQGQINPNMTDVSPFFVRMKDIAADLLFSEFGRDLFGYFVFVFCGVLFLDVVYFRKFRFEGLAALCGIVVVYVGLSLIGYLLPLADLEHTTKRGLFKMMPLMLLYLGHSAATRQVCDRIRVWEAGEVESAGANLGDKAQKKPEQIRP